MRAVLAIARAEILKSWKLIAVPLAAVIGVLVLWFSGVRTTDQNFQGSLMGILILFEFPLAAVPAVMLGLNLFGPDIRQRKLAFFMTRPCAPWQLLTGRLLGAAAIVSVGSLGGTLVLTMAGPGFTFGGGTMKSGGVFLFAAVLTGVVLLTNALAMILAANASRWFIADMVAAIAFLAAVAWSLDRALQFADPTLVAGAVMALLLSATFALFFGGLAFLSSGRGDGALGHRAHSLTVWVFGIVAILCLGAHRAYEWRRPIGGLLQRGVAISVSPTEALVSTSYWRGGNFLLDIRTGASRRLSGFASPWELMDLASPTLAYLDERLDLNARPDLLATHLVISPADPQGSPLVEWRVPDRLRRLLHVSEDGTLAAFSTAEGLEVVRPSSGEIQLRYPASVVKWAHFRGDRTLVAMTEEGASSSARLSVLTMEGKVIESQKFPIVQPNYWEAKLHSDSGRLAITEGRAGVTLYERDGTVIARLAPELVPARNGAPSEGYTSGSAVMFTRGGDFLHVSDRGLDVVIHGDRVVREVALTSGGDALAPARRRSLSGELESGEIVLFQPDTGPKTGPDLTFLDHGSILLVEPLTGVVRLSLPRHRSLVRGTAGRGRVTSISTPSQDSSLRLLQNEEDDLVFLDPGSTKPRLLVKSTAKRPR